MHDCHHTEPAACGSKGSPFVLTISSCGTTATWRRLSLNPTGLDMCAVCVTAGAIALNGDLPAVVDWVRGSILVYPARAVIAGPLLYHYIGGLRHIAWDHAKCISRLLSWQTLHPQQTRC